VKTVLFEIPEYLFIVQCNKSSDPENKGNLIFKKQENI
jgi:hypothetical protein